MFRLDFFSFWFSYWWLLIISKISHTHLLFNKEMENDQKKNGKTQNYITNRETRSVNNV